MSIPKEDVEAEAKNFDEHVLVGVTSAEPFAEYMERLKVVKAETNTEDCDFLVKTGQFEGFIDPRMWLPDAKSIIVLAVYYHDEECVNVAAEKDLRGRIARNYVYYPVAERIANKVADFLCEKGFRCCVVKCTSH